MVLSYKDIKLKPSYESGIDDLVQEFYIPVLSCAVSYDRIAGFFSSSSLSIAANGIAGLIYNHGRMRLIASPKISADDAIVISDVISNKRPYISAIYNNLLIDAWDGFINEFERDHLLALGWMLANHYLEIKLANVTDNEGRIKRENLFHEKIGILRDIQGNEISFSGSINESASGWLHNVEEFKVFKQWMPGQTEYFVTDQHRFDELWNGTRPMVKTYELPVAVREHIMERSKDFSIEDFIAKHYIQKKRIMSVAENLSLFPYQKKAMDLWIENNYSLLFEMATGTGKTRTALACVNKVMEIAQKLVVIITCPQTTLSLQWKNNEVDHAGFKFDCEITADGNNRRWKEELKEALIKISVGFYNQIVVYTTHDTSSSPKFIDVMMRSSDNIEFCFVGDEAHGLGAPKTKGALLERYKYRIGLSATPKRWFDEYGTNILEKYFGANSFRFSIADALSTINPLTRKPFLVEYVYKAVFVTLTDSELEEYQKLSGKISKLSHYTKNSDEYQKHYENLLFQRANIQKNAEHKMEALRELLIQIGDIDQTLLFVSDAQINEVMMMLGDMNIIAHRFTQDQGTRALKKYGGISEREYLINNFKCNNYQALVAINCLNEGIDIPSADTAILMSNSTNPREYVQRIGRVIRQSPNKKIAYIYDFIVEPRFNIYVTPELKAFEIQIFKNELKRAQEMAGNAYNNATVQKQLDAKLWEVEQYGIK